MDRELFDVSLSRWTLAGAGLAAGLVAIAGALTHSPLAGQCLQTSAATFGHCAWCYLAVGLLVAAAAPWPRLRRPRLRA